MPSSIRPRSAESVSLRALMQSALPLLSQTAASQAVSQNRVGGSRSALSCHQLKSPAHRMMRYVKLWASPSPLWVSRFFPGQALAPVCCCQPSAPCPSPLWHVPAACSACAPHRPHLDSVKPTRSVPAYAPPLPRSAATLDARAPPGATGGADPCSSAPSAGWPGLRGAVAGVAPSPLAS
jgi:hypothetical protein